MERLEKREKSLLKAIETLDESLDILEDGEYQLLYANLRDSAIKRFEYTIDQLWKFLKLIIQEKEAVDVKSAGPNTILKISVEYNLISKLEYDTLKDAILDRNLTSHSYNEELAEEILHSLRKYQETIKQITSRLS